MITIFIFIFGLIIGSFISALTWRISRGIGFVNDRSKCDRCGVQLEWYDNIPLISYFLLGGRCRKCGKKISIRYPLIEFSTGIIFVLIYWFFINCGSQNNASQVALICRNYSGLGYWLVPYLFFVTTVMIAIFVTDFEFQIIPDEFVFWLFGISLIIFPLFLREYMYEHLFSGFLMSIFLFILHIGTKGRGMGLGDVKLALFVGSFFGLKNSVSWIFLSFILGALIGIMLIVFGKTEFGKRIAFGPFLVISFFLTLFFGNQISYILVPYIY